MLSNLTLIFTIRIDSESRLSNIRSVLRYYSTNLPSVEIIVLEADAAPILSNMMKAEFPDVHYIFQKDENPVFHRTHFINIELKKTQTANAAIVDADVIIPISQLIRGDELLTANDEVVMVYPYDGRFVGLNQYTSDVFRRTPTIEALLSALGSINLLYGYCSVGGAFIVEVAKYLTLGAENEYFVGWGPEDFEREHRLDILGHKPLRIAGVIYHLEHSRGINSGNAKQEVAFATKREYCNVCSMLKDELIKYVESWPWRVK